MPVYHRIITGGGILRERKDLMKNKKLLGITAALAVAALTGGSLAIFAAETAAPEAEVIEAESIAEETEAEPEIAAPIVEETEVAPAAPAAETDDADYSYHVGQQSSTARNDAYEALPEGGTKEEAEEFYETYEVGGGAWADGAYDESLKSGYGYMAGQQRAAQYAQDGDDDEEYKAGYSYSVGRQNYMENYPNYSK